MTACETSSSCFELIRDLSADFKRNTATAIMFYSHKLSKYVGGAAIMSWPIVYGLVLASSSFEWDILYLDRCHVIFSNLHIEYAVTFWSYISEACTSKFTRVSDQQLFSLKVFVVSLSISMYLTGTERDISFLFSLNIIIYYCTSSVTVKK
jgi:hypothetical protein